MTVKRQYWSNYTPTMAASELHNRTNIDNVVNIVNIDSDDCNIFCNDSVEPYYYDTSSDLNFGYYTSDTFNLKIAKKAVLS